MILRSFKNLYVVKLITHRGSTTHWALTAQRSEVGEVVGVFVGARLGEVVGALVGAKVGEVVGVFVGEVVGVLVGAKLGEVVGVVVGEVVGASVGDSVGGVGAVGLEVLFRRQALSINPVWQVMQVLTL